MKKRFLKLFGLTSLLAIVALALTSCYQKPVELSSNEIKLASNSLVQKKISENLSKDEYIKQPVIQEILELQFSKQKQDAKDKPEDLVKIDKEKEEYVQKQLVDNDALVKELEIILAYFSTPRRVSLNRTDTIVDLDKARRMFNKFLEENWLFFIFNYQAFTYLATVDPVFAEGFVFADRFSRKIEWLLKANSNQIKDYSSVKYLASYAGSTMTEPYNSKQPTYKTDPKTNIPIAENWPFFNTTYYLKMANNSIVRISALYNDETKPVKISIDSRISGMEYILDGSVKDFPISNFARFLHQIDTSVEIADNKHVSNRTFFEARYGETIPFNLSSFNKNLVIKEK